ncbi:MAG: hypothetical protein JNL32_07180, partial [Candidatus Kapabacteria bacterium]|nr:hypothetical protein [Candidatus Kapabacteria bacterium]
MNSRLTSTRFWKTFLLSTVLTLLITGDVFAQVYQATLRQRRYGDQLHVEVWMRSLSTSAPKLGESSLVIQYNSSFLTPAATQAPSTSDTIQYDVDQATPPVTITSGFDAANGYQALATQNYGSGFYSLEVRKSVGGTTGLVPASTGRGSFIGKMIFDITTTGLQDNTLSLVQWSASTLPGDVVIFDYNDTD